MLKAKSDGQISSGESSPSLPRSHSDEQLASGKGISVLWTVSFFSNFLSGITKQQKQLVREFSSNCDYNPKPHEILPPGDADVS